MIAFVISPNIPEGSDITEQDIIDGLANTMHQLGGIEVLQVDLAEGEVAEKVLKLLKEE